MTIYLFSFLTSLGEYSYFVPLPELLIWPLGGLCHGSSVSTGPVANQNLKHFREKLITSYLFPVLIMYVCVCMSARACTLTPFTSSTHNAGATAIAFSCSKITM